MPTPTASSAAACSAAASAAASCAAAAAAAAALCSPPLDADADADAAAVRAVASRLSGADADLDPLLAAIAGSRAAIVLLGEATHGTHEIYETRAAISRRLIAEQGFSAVLLEADHPDTALLDAFARSQPLPPPAHELPAAFAKPAAAAAAAPPGGEPAAAAASSPSAFAAAATASAAASAAGGRGDFEDSAVDALAGFVRFPAWMWRNCDVVLFLSWLRAHNAASLAATAPDAGAATLPAPLPLRAAALRSCGLFGMDLYAMFKSIRAVLRYLDGEDAEAAGVARGLYAAFDGYGEDTHRYGAATALGASCKAEAEAVLRLLEERQEGAVTAAAAAAAAGEDSSVESKLAALRSADALFSAVEEARLVVDAEAYYVAMFARGESTWNSRDAHMLKALSALLAHLRRREACAAAIAAQEQGVPAARSLAAELRLEPPRVVVWAHNSHIGDARATEMSRRGELNLGQLAREAFGGGERGVFVVGFTTFAGTVTAAEAWDAPARCMRLRPALAGSVEELFHRASSASPAMPRFLVDLRKLAATARAGAPAERACAAAALAALSRPRLERFVGVLYKPATERSSHYFSSVVSAQFDVVIHLDRTRAVEPLETVAPWVASGDASAEDEATFPSGL